MSDKCKPEHPYITVEGNDVGALRIADQRAHETGKPVHLTPNKTYFMEEGFKQSDCTDILTPSKSCKATLKFSDGINVAFEQARSKRMNLDDVILDTAAIRSNHHIAWFVHGVWRQRSAGVMMVGPASVRGRSPTNPFDPNTPNSYGMVLRGQYSRTGSYTSHPVAEALDGFVMSNMGSSFGDFYNMFTNFWIDGYSVGRLQISREQNSSPKSRVNQNLFEAGAIRNTFHHSYSQGIGGGMTDINVSKENSVSPVGTKVLDQSAGTGPVVIQGEHKEDYEGVGLLLNTTGAGIIDGLVGNQGVQPTHIRITPAQARVRGRVPDNI